MAKAKEAAETPAAPVDAAPAPAAVVEAPAPAEPATVAAAAAEAEAPAAGEGAPQAESPGPEQPGPESEPTPPASAPSAPPAEVWCAKADVEPPPARTLHQATAIVAEALGLEPAVARERLEHVAAAIGRRYGLGGLAATEALIGNTHGEALVVLCAQSHDEMARAAPLAGCHFHRQVPAGAEV